MGSSASPGAGRVLRGNHAAPVGRCGVVSAWLATVVIGMCFAAPVQAGDRRIGHPGPVRWGAPSCSIGADGHVWLALPTVAVKMQAYWAQPHNGTVATDQYVRLLATVTDNAGGGWHVESAGRREIARLLATRNVRHWRDLPVLAKFDLGSGADYKFAENVNWYDPTNRHHTGRASMVRSGSCRPSAGF